MKNIKRVLSVLLVAALLMSVCGSAFASEEKPFKYVAFGDSTCNGYNSDEYYSGMSDFNCVANERIYPNLLGNYLSETLDREVDVNCMIFNGMRAHDLRAVLDPEYSLDQYSKDHLDSWAQSYGSYEKLHEAFCDAIADADMVSVDIFMSSLGNYFANRIKSALGIGNGEPYEEFYADDTLYRCLGGDYDKAIKLLTGCRKNAESILAKAGIPQSTVSKLIDTYEYASLALMVNFSECVKLIYDLNDDVQLVVMSPFATTCYDLTLSNLGIDFSLGSLLQLYIKAVYDYADSVDSNRSRYILADMHDTYLSCFTDGIAKGEWDSYKYVTEEIRSILLENGVAVDKNVSEQEEYFRNTVCPNIEKALSNTEFDLTLAPIDAIKLLVQDKDNIPELQ